jgi:hypothetical protein
MWKRRTPLQRKTELKRAPMKRTVRYELKRTPIAPKSAKQRKRDYAWRKCREAWLVLNPHCAVCFHLKLKLVKATEVHHKRGRNGDLLCDTRYLASTCRGHREWPHEHPSEARAAGLLSSAADWNVVPKSVTS